MCFLKKHVLFLFLEAYGFSVACTGGLALRTVQARHRQFIPANLFRKTPFLRTVSAAVGTPLTYAKCACVLRKVLLIATKMYHKRAATLIFNMAFVLAFVNYGPHALNVGPLRRLSAHTARKNFFNDILYHICKLPCKGHSGIKNAVTALAFTSVFDVVSLWSRRCMP